MLHNMLNKINLSGGQAGSAQRVIKRLLRRASVKADKRADKDGHIRHLTDALKFVLPGNTRVQKKLLQFVKVRRRHSAPLTQAHTPLPLAAYSEPADDQSADAIVVTAPLLARDKDLAEAAERLDQRAGGTTLVAAKDYDKGRATTLGDMMTYAPGVFAQTRHGEEVRLSIRGSGIQRGFLMRGVQIYQDGIPMNLADGGGDYQAIDPLAVQHIEIWRGANALEYGASTLGGAINIVTPTGRTADTLGVRLDAGSYDQRRAHATIAGAGEALDGMMSVTYGQQEGWREHSSTKALRVSGNIGYRFSDSLEGRLYLTHVDSDLQLPGSITLAAMTANRRQAAPNAARLHAGNYYDLNRAAARFTWTPAQGRQVIASAYIAHRDRFHPMTMAILTQDSTDIGADVRGVFDFGSKSLTRRFVIGASAARYEGTEGRFTNPDGKPGTPTGLNDLEAQLYALYGEYSHNISPALLVQLGGQVTRATRRLDNRTTPTGSYNATFTAFSPKFGLIWTATDSDQLFANVSRSFEPAPFGEAPIRPLLPMPRAQRATTLEAGWRHRAGPVQLEATAYRAWLDDELLALTDATGTTIGTANADRTIHQGLELGARLPLTSTVSARGTYLFNDFRFDGDAFYGNNRIAGIPKHMLHAEVEWKPASWFTIAPSVEWQPGGVWIDHANSVKQKGYALAHLRLHGDIGQRLNWFADARNIFDRAYVAGTAVQANARGKDGAYYFPGDPRAVYVGLGFKY